ncbi:MAG: gamma-glutamyl-gamma-aminobutyrate hydrolase family protein [Candidatus Limnocylindrales bacterium]
MSPARRDGLVPRIVVTIQAPAHAPDPDLARRKNARYFEELAAAGGEAVALDEDSSTAEREAAFGAMEGLLLTGGADVDPARYGAPAEGSRDTQPGRDALEAAAFGAARERGVPILGICRGFQAINVFMGGRLVQHLEGHGSPPYPSGPARRHPLHLRPATRLARILRPSDPNGGVLSVNTYHHQAVRREDLAPGLIVAGLSQSSLGELVEAFEAEERDAFIVGVQCHPERVESTPPEFGRLWRVFVDAASGAVRPTGPAGERRPA